jgi:hypothetical protein
MIRTTRRRPGVGLGALLLALALSPALWIGSVTAQDDGFGPPAPPVESGPRIKISEPDFDWGQVLQGEVVEHVYRVINEGDQPLRITQVKPG